MSKKVAMFDTNTYVNHYLGYEPIIDLFDQLLEEEFEIHMSSIVVMELMWYDKVESIQEIRDARQGYIDEADYILDVTEDVALKAAEIRRKWQIKKVSACDNPEFVEISRQDSSCHRHFKLQKGFFISIPFDPSHNKVPVLY